MKVEVPNDNNLTNSEWKVLYDIKNGKRIVIKSADKSSAVVVWDREDYMMKSKQK